ncbi:MAG: PrsW family glutamic-type intramembrane protease, partial [Acidobacteria bacterium]|nr:PrsW family glutamic-type intramembrane protease [Acidobacteriota bacterium]
MPHAFIVFSALVPSLLLVWYFHSRDVYPEPPRVLWTVFILGVATVLPVVLVARPFDALLDQISSPLAYGFASAFVQAAIPEELFKFLVVWFFAARHRAFDEPIDGVIYGVVASLGFATLENVLYVAGGGLHVAVTRALTAVPSHAFLGAIMGYFVGRAKFSAERGRFLAWALLLPILL